MTEVAPTNPALPDEIALGVRVRFPVVGKARPKVTLQFRIFRPQIGILAEQVPEPNVVRPLSVVTSDDVKVNGPNVRLGLKRKGSHPGRLHPPVDIARGCQSLDQLGDDVKRGHGSNEVQNGFGGQIGNRCAADVLDVDNEIPASLTNLAARIGGEVGPGRVVIDNLHRMSSQSDHWVFLHIVRADPVPTFTPEAICRGLCGDVLLSSIDCDAGSVN